MLRIRADTIKETTWSLCASRRIALSFDVIGFLSSQSAVHEAHVRVSSLSQSHCLPLISLLLSFTIQFQPNDPFVICSLILRFIFFAISAIVVVYARCGGHCSGSVIACCCTTSGRCADARRRWTGPRGYRHFFQVILLVFLVFILRARVYRYRLLWCNYNPGQWRPS